jgi:hypothetical protein
VPEFSQGLQEIAPDLLVEFDGWRVRICQRNLYGSQDVYFTPDLLAPLIAWLLREELIK